ncbi:hypothetical protein ACIP20_01085 [Marinilactibacillus psychrotolerans]
MLIDNKFSNRKKESISLKFSGFDISKNIKGYPLRIDELDLIGIPIPLMGIKIVSIDRTRLIIKSFHLLIYISPHILFPYPIQPCPESFIQDVIIRFYYMFSLIKLTFYDRYSLS